MLRASLELDGGHLALDFVNTLGGSRELGPQPHDEHLRKYADLLAWSVRAGMLSELAAERLAAAAEAGPRRARRVLAEAIALREQADSVFRPLAEGAVPSKSGLEALREAEVDAVARARIDEDGGAFGWRWDDTEDLRRPLWPLAHASVELLTEGPLERLKICGECRWLFLDASKNRSRRWCNMDNCGTSVKMRRYTERRRARRGSITEG